MKLMKLLITAAIISALTACSVGAGFGISPTGTVMVGVGG